MGLLIWNYEQMFDISLQTLAVQKVSLQIPTRTSPPSGSSYGVATRHTDGSIYVIASEGIGNPTGPVVYELSPDWTTWTGIGPQWDQPDGPGEIIHWGAARIGSQLVTLSSRVSLGNGHYSVFGWDFAGNMQWEYQFVASWITTPSDLEDESGPECLQTDGTHIYWTTEGATVWSFNCVTHNSDPVRAISLLDDPAYTEDDGAGDIDLQGSAWDAAQGRVFAWGGRVLPWNSLNAEVHVFSGQPTGGWRLEFSGLDPTNALQRTDGLGNFRNPSFSGTAASDGTYLYMLNDQFGPYVARLRVASPVGGYDPHVINVGSLIASPSALVAATPDFAIPNLTGALGSVTCNFDP